MAGLHQGTPIPTSIEVHQRSRILEIIFNDGMNFKLPFEFLRVYTPSAEARGHGPGQEVLQTGKRNVLINQIEQVGNYAIRPYFSDGHSTGIFDWDLLYNLGVNYEELWQSYLNKLEQYGQNRDEETSPSLRETRTCGTNRNNS